MTARTFRWNCRGHPFQDRLAGAETSPWQCAKHRAFLARFKVGRRNVSVPIISMISCNEIDSSLNACINGLGLGMFLSYQVAPYRKNRQLKYLLEQFEPEPIPVHVVYPRSNLLSNRTRAFVDECVQRLRRVRFD